MCSLQHFKDDDFSKKKSIINICDRLPGKSLLRLVLGRIIHLRGYIHDTEKILLARNYVIFCHNLVLMSSGWTSVALWGKVLTSSALDSAWKYDFAIFYLKSLWFTQISLESILRVNILNGNVSLNWKYYLKSILNMAYKIRAANWIGCILLPRFKFTNQIDDQLMRKHWTNTNWKSCYLGSTRVTFPYRPQMALLIISDRIDLLNILLLILDHLNIIKLVVMIFPGCKQSKKAVPIPLIPPVENVIWRCH